LIMPQVLFSGAILAVPSMNEFGLWVSRFMITRWSFEALGHQVDVETLLRTGRSRVGRTMLTTFDDTFSRDVVQNWRILGAFIVVAFVLTCVILRRRSATT